VLFGTEVDVQNTAGHIDFIVEEAEGRNRPFVRAPDCSGVPFVGGPRDFYSV
jgi:hypothetical protein